MICLFNTGLVHAYEISDLAGTWYWGGIGTQQNSLPDNFGYDTGTFTFQSNGSFIGTMTDDGGNSWNEAGSASVTSDGKVTMNFSTGGGGTMTPALNAGKDVMISNWQDPTEFFLDILVKKGNSYSTSDLTGIWYWRGIGTQKDSLPDDFGYDTGTFTFQNDGSFTGTMVDDEGDSWDEAGSASVASDGKVTMNFSTGGGGTMTPALNAGKNVMISNWQDPTELFFDILVKRAGSYSTSDLEGTWYLQSIKTQRNGQQSDNFGFYTANLDFEADGSFAGTMRNDSGSSWSESGSASVSSDGTVTLSLHGNTLDAALNASKDVIIADSKSSNRFVLDVLVKKESILSIPDEPITDEPSIPPEFGSSELLIWDYTGSYAGPGGPGFVSLALFKEELEDAGIFNPSRDGMIIAHGWNSSTAASWVTETAAAISQSGFSLINVFAWDWEENAESVWGWYRPTPTSPPIPIYPTPPTEHVTLEFNNLAEALAHPALADIREASSIGFIGHSLGAAVSSRTAELLEKNDIAISRVSLLDAPEDFVPYVIG